MAFVASEDGATAPPTLSAVQAAVRLKVSGRTVRRWAAAGELPALRIRGRYWIEESDLERMIVRTGAGDE